MPVRKDLRPVLSPKPQLGKKEGLRLAATSFNLQGVASVLNANHPCRDPTSVALKHQETSSETLESRWKQKYS